VHQVSGGNARLLGPPVVEIDGSRHELPVTKASAVLLYLACRGEWIDRDELLYVFYPDNAESPGRSNLRQLLTSLRRLPYGTGLAFDSSRLRWTIPTDLRAFREALREGRWADAVQQYSGELLAGFSPHGLPDFESWLALERSSAHAGWREATFALADVLSASARPAQARELLATLHRARPLDEEPFQRYVRALQQDGRHGEARDAFRAFAARLRREYGGEPELATLRLFGDDHEARDVAKPGAETASAAQAPDAAPVHAAPHGVPSDTTPFIGREAEKARVTELLARPSCRLLTITGPGGIGKTRLAVETARGQPPHFPGGVWFVSLAAIASPELVAFKLGASLGFTFYGREPPSDQLASYLHDKMLLLVLDNFEHLPGASPLVAELLTRCPHLKVLVTSRVPLHVYGEHEFATPAFAVPDPEGTLAAVGRNESVRLFVERASAVDTTFELTADNAGAVVSICEHLEGLPLAIELAAARSKLLPPRALLPKLRHRLDFLTAGPRDVPTRQQTLRNTIDWSYVLLTESEQALFRRLSVFRGGFTLSAVDHVLDPDDAHAATTGVAALLDKSLLRRAPSRADEPRFALLETLREYASDKLREHDESAHLEQRHLHHVVAMAEDAAADLLAGGEVDGRLVWLEEERGNWRIALHRALEHDQQAAVRLALALSAFWDHHPEMEGLAWLEAVLATDAASDAARARLLLQAGMFTDLCRGDVTGATSQFVESLRLARRSGDDRTAVRAIPSLILVALQRGDAERAYRLGAEGVPLARRLADGPRLAHMLTRAGVAALAHGRRTEAIAFIEEGLSVAHAWNDTRHERWASYYLTGLALVDERPDAALHAGASIVPTACDTPNIDNTHAFEMLGRALLESGRFDEARRHFEVTLRFFRKAGIKPCCVHTLEAFARLALRTGEHDRAARLLGSAQHVLETHPFVMLPVERALFEQTAAAILADRSQSNTQSALAEGRTMPLPQAIAYALSVDDEGCGEAGGQVRS
jgi:predicted ATPase/DNA-binding SARP family transcriptional activator